ncbi:MAG: hypothetical protein ACK5XN_39965 [Bacteroidota bacterium]|jgi:hypothetical protein
MPISIARAQQEALSELGGMSEAIGQPVKLAVAAKALLQYGQEFEIVLGKIVNERQVVDSGDLTSKLSYQLVGNNTLQVVLPDYYDYPNKGVKGVKFSRNAPNSPYQFKHYRMSDEGRAKIRASIARGKMKLRIVRNDKALGIGTERKRLSAAESTENTLIYMIKKYGIKATKYFDDAVKDVFKDFDIVMGEAIGADLVLNLERKK